MSVGASDEERIAALRLARSAEIGPVTFRKLVDRFGSALAAIDALPELAQNSGRASQLRLQSVAGAVCELEQADKIGARLLVQGDGVYPDLLAAAEGAPAILFARGELATLMMPSIAIVGARNASANGRKLAESLAAGLGARGFVVVSGLARGIDAAAHRGALKTGTLAVLAGGIDRIYPEEHAELYEAICDSGLIVSEMPFGQVARAADFPRRNRIIAGLAQGTVVVEAAERSGSLITARLAGEMGREVLAVPGSPLDARCRGTNQLLKDGAVLVETVEDIIASLPARAAQPPRPARRADHIIEPRIREQIAEPVRAKPVTATQPLPARLVELLGPSPTSIDDLVRATGASAAEIQAALFDLEIEGVTLRHPGQLVSRAVKS